MIPGIDFAGVVESSTSDAWREGERVLLNGWGVGEGHWGGLAQKARVNPAWLQRLPEPFTASKRWRSAPRATPPLFASKRW